MKITTMPSATSTRLMNEWYGALKQLPAHWQCLCTLELLITIHSTDQHLTSSSSLFNWKMTTLFCTVRIVCPSVLLECAKEFTVRSFSHYLHTYLRINHCPATLSFCLHYSHFFLDISSKYATCLAGIVFWGPHPLSVLINVPIPTPSSIRPPTYNQPLTSNHPPTVLQLGSSPRWYPSNNAH